MSEFKWPESVPWLTADDVVPFISSSGHVHHIHGHQCPYCYSIDTFGEPWHLADEALDEAGAFNAKTPQAAADAWNRAMASLGYCEVYEV